MKILWALNPFHQSDKFVKSMHGLLGQIAASRSDIEIGFVANRLENDLNLAFDVPLKDRFDAYPRKLLRNLIGKAKIKMSDRQINVLNGDSFSTTQTVDGFLSLAKQRRCDLIALYTHAHHGYARFIMGSFAESALHRSKVSVLLVNPKTSFPAKIQKVLFASDYGPDTKKRIKPVLKLCAQLNAELVVFHHGDPVLSMSLDQSYPAVREYSGRLLRMENWIQKESARFGVSCKVVVASQSIGTADLILKMGLKLKSDLIVVNAKAGPLAALMGGSVTRQVVRAASKPVLVLK